MFLTASQINKVIEDKEISIVPFEPKYVKGASYTFTLGNKIKTLKKKDYLDSREDPEFDEAEIPADGYVLNPGDFAILYTKEVVTLNNKYVCLLSTRATIAMMGLDVMQSSFFCEPDTNNPFGLEVTNAGPLPVRIYPGTKIVKGVFSRVE